MRLRALLLSRPRPAPAASRAFVVPWAARGSNQGPLMARRRMGVVVAAADLRTKAAAYGVGPRHHPPPPREMVLPLASALRDHVRSVGLGAATLLGALGPEARAALPVPEAAREAPDAGVRDAVASALQQIAPR